MTAVFAFAAIVGWPFLLFFVFFGGENGDIDADLDADFDVDLDVEVDGDLDTAGSFGGGVAAAVLSILSFRSIVFFLAFFGATGLILTALSTGSVVALIVAIALGLFAATLNNRVFRYLKTSSVGSDVNDRALSGAVGRVTVPISVDSKGRITCEVEGRTINLTAIPFDAREEGEFGVGETVVVVEVNKGTARVSSFRELS
jgi:membrane protein implicated in regulation of membrane protease activity